MTQQNSKMSISLDYRLICIVLVLIIVGMLSMWRPWSNPSSGDRTIKVTGETTLKSIPDEFVFYPSYEFKNADKETALEELSAKSEQVIAKLKELGVEEKDIKTNSSNYEKYYYDHSNSEQTYTLQITVTVDSLEKAQTIQDYLVSTTPSGTISPQAQFSDAKQKQLESQARDEATKNAREKADQSAKNLGATIGDVKSVEDGQGFDGVMPYDALMAERSTSSGLAVQPGENEVHYSVTVTYYLK